jgi:hypothetical protein
LGKNRRSQAGAWERKEKNSGQYFLLAPDP